jgi:hypothetical protein
VAKIQSVNFGKTYTCFVFSTKLGDISWENYLLEGNTTLRNKCNIKHLNIHFQQIVIVNYFSQSKGQGPTKSLFVAHHP